MKPVEMHTCKMLKYLSKFSQNLFSKGNQFYTILVLTFFPCFTVIAFYGLSENCNFQEASPYPEILRVRFTIVK